MSTTYAKAGIIKKLEELGKEVHTTTPDGTPVTREEALALNLWNCALGWTETKFDRRGEDREVKHPPATWAMQYVTRCLGGEDKVPVPPTKDKEEGKTPSRSLQETRKLSEQRKNSINNLTDEVVGDS